MSLRRTLTSLTAVVLMGGAASLAAAAPASAQTPASSMPTGTRSLATVLARDGSGFDHNWRDFDIVDNAVAAVLAAKPDSPVAVLADGSVPLTAFLPTDDAFRRLARDLTHKHYGSERAVFADVASLGIDTVEAVLLYHVVPGATVTYRQALKADGARLTTASGGTLTVRVKDRCWVTLVDADPDDANAQVVRRDINKGNLQVAHGIDRVLRPVDL
jgi:uncharacterized surface protein with fasciclin (FAS1) repeats